MNDIVVVIPTLDLAKGTDTGKLAMALAGCKVAVRVVVSVDEHREGFTKTANKGMRAATPDEDVCLLNDDILQFQYGWLEILRRALYSNPRYGIAGPSGRSSSAPASGGAPGQIGTREVGQLSFWCVLFKREMLNELGLLGEAFIHYCSDTWYCNVMRQKGWKCVWAKAAYLKHRHHGSGIPGKWKQHDRKIYFKRLGR